MRRNTGKFPIEKCITAELDGGFSFFGYFLLSFLTS